MNSTLASRFRKPRRKGQVSMKTTVRKIFQGSEGKKITNDEKRGQTCDMMSESTVYSLTREPNAV